MTQQVDDPVFDARVNVLGSIRVYACAAAAGVGKVIYASSGGACYGDPEQLPAAEDTPIGDAAGENADSESGRRKSATRPKATNTTSTMILALVMPVPQRQVRDDPLSDQVLLPFGDVVSGRHGGHASGSGRIPGHDPLL